MSASARTAVTMKSILVVLLVWLGAAGCGAFSSEEPTGKTQQQACTGVKLSTAPTGPVSPGAVVTLTATSATCASGETAEYRFAYKRDGTADPYSLVQDWSSASSASWSTAGLPSGKYLLVAYARAAGSSASFDSMAYAQFLLDDVCTAASTMISPAGPQPPGTTLTLAGASACNGGATPEYRFLYKRSDQASYTALGPYSTANAVPWDTTALTPGTYNLIVYVRASGNASTFEAVGYANYLLGAVCSSVSLAATPPSPSAVGTLVGLNASATCASGASPEFRFFYRPVTTTVLTEIQAYSSSPTTSWTTSALTEGAYVLVVYVRAQGNTSVAEATASLGYSLGTELRVSAGMSHTCLVANGGTKCFGRNVLGGPTGQHSFDRGLEPSDMGNNLPAVSLAGTVTAVARGAYHTCALLSDDTVRCWGANDSGALGLGDKLHRTAGNGALSALPAVPLGSGKLATAIAAGSGFTCALLNDNSVKCWGANGFGQLGLGDTNDRGDAPGEMGDALPAVNLGTGRTAKAIAAGVGHVCAILDDDSLKCWGYNTFGGLGVGDNQHRGDAAGEMGDSLPPVSLGAGRFAVSVSAGAYQTCAVLDTNQVKCWGYNAWGQLGLGDTLTRGTVPSQMGDALPTVQLGTGRTVKNLVVGGHDACAILDNDTLMCWGYNAEGQLGLGDTAHRGDQTGEMGDNLPAVSLGTGRYAVRQTASYINRCAQLDDGALKCWGANWSGMLGIGPSDNRGDHPGEMGDALPSFQLSGAKQVVSLGSGFGYHHACGILSNGDLKCWGANSFGQLGIDRSSNVGDESSDMGTGLQYADLGSVSVVSVQGGDSHTCALISDGRVKCWGANRYGTLGQGDTRRRDGRASLMGNNLPFVNLGTGRTAVQLSVGSNHACAVLDNGAIKCWGHNGRGQLGLGDTSDRGDDPNEMGDSLPAVALGAGLTAVAVSAGYWHTCALLTDASVKCWGYNWFGQLGIGSNQDTGDASGELGDALPRVPLGTGRSALAVYAGLYNSCAILDNGSVKCWGANGFGQLGQGDTTVRGNLPNQMGDALPAISLGTGRTASALSMGQQHTCALLDNRTLKCWGNNAFGKLGYGDTNHRGDNPGEMGDALSVVSLGSGKSVVDVASGWYHSCAVLNDSTLKCWGRGTGGELGLGGSHTLGDQPGEMGNALPVVNLGPL